jgi:polyadenylate-binding protein
MLGKMTPSEQKQVLGERLFVLVQQIVPNLAAKITGMFIELDTKYILILIKSHKILKEKV